MVQDANRLVVFGSQLIGVVIVIVGLWTQQSKLQSPRPAGGKTQTVATPDWKGDHFARLWDDPFEDVSEIAVLRPRAAVQKRGAGGPSTSIVAQLPPASAPSPAPSNSTGPLSITAKSPPPISAPAQDVHPCRRVHAPKVKKPPAVTSSSPIESNSPSPSPIVTDPTPAPPSPSPSPGFTKLLIWNILDARQVPEIKERRLRIRYAAVSAVLSADYLPKRESSLSPLTGKPSEPPTAQEGKDLIGYFETFETSKTPKAAASFERVILVWTPREVPLDPGLIEHVKQQIEGRDKEKAEGEVEVRVLHHGSSQDLEDYAEEYSKSPKPKLAGKISFMRATLAGKKFDQFRPIISDDRLIDALFDELSLRIPALNTALREEKDRPRIVVVAESDTRYSHAIKEQLDDRFEGRARLVFYTYLRGLDGRSEDASSAPDSDKSEKNSETASDNGKGKGFQERSLGTSQFDYLRRLAVGLGSQTSSRRGHGVSAVGILGSDIYDKMLVLQALQPELPGAIFFTTDLDALYLERVNQRYTRNLVVAGADSLVGSRGLPPMRDGYQTILARKVSELIGLPDFQSTTTPHVFEIAPGKSVDLKADSAASSHTAVRDFVLRLLSYTWMNVVLFCLALANACFILTAIFTREAREEVSGTVIAPMKSGARIFVYTEVILAIGAIGFLLFFLGWRKDTLLFAEPLALGISIWPSVMIRLLAFLVAILFLGIASYTFVAQGKGIREKVQNALPREIKNIQFSLPQSLAREGVRLCKSLAGERPEPSPPQTFQPHVDKFFSMDQPWWRNYRVRRIILISIAYFAVSAYLFRQWPPTVPGRGAFALLDEKIVLALGVSLYIIHLIFCLDLHYHAFIFLRALRAVYAPESWKKIERKGVRINAKQILEATSTFTSIIGKTLLYPLTVLILIILSRLPHFDNWPMTPSLTITFLLGALALVIASLFLWVAGSRLKKEVLDRHGEAAEIALGELLQAEAAAKSASAARQATSPDPTEEREAKIREKHDAEVRAALKKEREELEAVNQGVFAAWYSQPIFAAIFSVAAVFGSLSIAGPLARLFFE